jgi:exodeoxyribonuclease VII large subunit
LSTSTYKILTVTQLSRLARLLLEEHFSMISVEGEISSFNNPSSGHWYFTLKDDKAQVRCAMFKNRNFLTRIKPQDGLRVLIHGRVSLYENRGDFQLLVDSMEATGTGALSKAFDELKHRLKVEGLFDSQHKKDLPSLPKHLALITSSTSAALHDVLSVLHRRFPSLKITLIPSLVQGQEAVTSLIKALQCADGRQGCLADVDLILLTRGGGSLEDLWCFNDEALARTIFACELPIISAVGHEVDFTIADFVADVRAPTPSAAAEMLSPDSYLLLQRVDALLRRLKRLQLDHLNTLRQHLDYLRKRLQHPGRRLQQQTQRLDELELRLRRSLNQQLFSYRQKLQSHERTLLAISPLATLHRGYSITTSDNGKIIRNFKEVSEGDILTTHLAMGQLTSRVEKLISTNSKNNI